jgi:WD40 repeat protein
VLAVAFSPDSNRLVTASSDRKCMVWEVEDGDLVAPLEGHKAWCARRASAAMAAMSSRPRGTAPPGSGT